MLMSPDPVFVVVMGVAGCGKSSLGQRCAQAWQLPLLEGDDFHSADNLAKMRSGRPLTDADRQAWLGELATQLLAHPQGAVLTCSALRRRYRDRLRQAVPSLRFLFLSLSEAQSRERVAARSAHLFPVSLVASQFEALQDPGAEAGVLCLDAMRPLALLAADALRWIASATPPLLR
jgi:gluconokinase